MATDIDDVLDIIGFGGTQLLLLAGYACSTVFVICEIMTVPMVPVACEFELNGIKLFLMTSAGFLGMIISGHYAGYKSDIIGRREMLLYTMSLALVSSFISLLMPWFYAYIFFRFATGIFAGGVMTISFTFLVEYTKISLRAVIANFATYPVCTASILMPLMNHLLAPLHKIVFSMGTFDVRMWRVCMTFNYIPCIIGLLVYYSLPESPKFLISVGQSDAAYAALDMLCKRNRGKGLQEMDVKSVTQPHTRVSTEEHLSFIMRMWKETKPLFVPPYVNSIVLITLIMCAIFFVGNGMSLWFMKINHNVSTEKRIMCDHLESSKIADDPTCTEKPVNYLENMMVGVAGLGCCVYMSIFLRLIKRRYVMFINTFVSAICGFSLNFLDVHMMLLAALLIFVVSCSTSISLAAACVADLVPTYLRAKAVSLVFVFARIAVILANFIIGNFIHDYCLITFNLFVIVILAAAIMILFLPV